MLVKTQKNHLKDAPSPAIKDRWVRFQVGKGNQVNYTNARFLLLDRDERAKIKKLIKAMSKKARATFRKEYNAAFAAAQWLRVNLIEFVHSHQREPVCKIITDILSALCGLEVNSIKIAILKQIGKPDRYICYDGQHTLIVLVLLRYKKVPIDVKVVYNIAAVRELFRLANGKGIHGKVSAVEDFRQEVLRYVEDGIRDSAAQLANQIHQLLVKNNMAMDGEGKILNSISRISELRDILKTTAHRQAYIDCYKYRIGNNIDTAKHSGFGSKESVFYAHLITEARFTTKQINKITDYLYKHRGTSVAYASSDFWNDVDDYSGAKEKGGALAYLKHEYNVDPSLKDFGVTL